MPVNEIVATGGLPERNKLLMQIYADVTGRPIKIAGTHRAGRLGSAMYGAVAAGQGSRRLRLPSSRPRQRMASLRKEGYEPNPREQARLRQLYREYVTLHDYFGRGANDVMKRLKMPWAHALRCVNARRPLSPPWRPPRLIDAGGPGRMDHSGPRLVPVWSLGRANNQNAVVPALHKATDDHPATPPSRC